MNTLDCDLLIIGGGINGVGVAVEAASRGLSVILCEKDDLAHHTSSASTKLIHGGLRYLEQFDFKLVREALREREILLKKAPFLVRPLQFVLPYESHLRPVWMLRLGLWLYDHLAKRQLLPPSRKLNFSKNPKILEAQPLKAEFKLGFSYSDCKTDDARLVVINAMAAREYGAKILTRTVCKHLTRKNGYWLGELLPANEEKIMVHAKAVVNATGVWAIDTLTKIADIKTDASIKSIKGSHIVVPKLYTGEHAYILQNKDRRIIFVIPYQNEFSLIGTTDLHYSGDPNQVKISPEEIHYLLESVNQYFERKINPEEICWTYAGLRPLFDDRNCTAAQLSREYHFDMQDENSTAPILSIFGGKLTTYRALAVHAVEKLKPYFSSLKEKDTINLCLPGWSGGISYEKFVENILKKYFYLPPKLLQRYLENYGNRIEILLKNVHQLSDLGDCFGVDLYTVEVDYLRQYEWAQTTDDILWRRTKLGLYFTVPNIQKLENYMANRTFIRI